MTANPRPEHTPVPCHLPATGAWVAYRRDADRHLHTLGTFPFCRLDREPQHAAARQLANTVPASEYYGAFPVEYSTGQSRIACTGERAPVQLAAALDAERIAAAADAARTALREIVHLTTVAVSYSHEIGNESAALQALLDLVDDVEDEAGVVARRLASRAGPNGWFRVAEVAGNVRPEDLGATKLSVATKLWRRWGGGLDDDVAPVLPAEQPQPAAGGEGSR